MKRAVCVLIPYKVFIPQVFIGVTRRNDVTKVGLPGGKVDPGETEEMAAVRETYEETGIMVNPDFLVPIYAAYCPGEVGYWVTTYLYIGPHERAAEIRQLEEGVIPVFCEQNVLCNAEKSPFAKYNEGVFAAYKQYKEAQ